MPSSPDSVPTTRRRTTKAAVSPDVDHRKRRRNRTTQSCLNCHATKRMCDRKRPCSRCTQLGLTGLCVYEVDDPARQSDAQDESSRLLNRIAELESVVRELKNKPHPRWVDALDTTPLHFPPGAPASPLRSPPYIDVNLPRLSSFGDMPWSDLLNWDSSSSGSSYSYSPGSTPSPLLISASRPPEPSFPCQDPTWNQTLTKKSDPDCNCMSEAACYNTALQLANELRRAARSLPRSLSHCFGSPCTLTAKICELESFIMDTLRSNRCPDDFSAAVRVNEVYRPANVRPGELNSVGRDPFWDESGLPAYDDSFMSWIPPAAVVQKHF
ncbi:hypothetical protein FB451DRAFT_228081 [Mycena latifolia]|nr:hypothetical protein FB451DRAFT_228081 [Mycena latifolia]